MQYLVIDIETIPDQTPNAIDDIAKDFEVKSPDLTKPKLIDALELDPATAKFKTVPELKEMWLDKFAGQAKVEQAKEKWLKTSFDGGRGQICEICISNDDFEKSYTDKDYESEADMLKAMWYDISEEFYGRCPTLVAHNAKFDLPFVYHRCVVNKVNPVIGFKPHGRHDSDYFCTMEAWAGFGGKISLNRLASYLGINGKDGMTGADVWPEYQKGNHEKISEYCRDDARITKQIYKRLKFA